MRLYTLLLNIINKIKSISVDYIVEEGIEGSWNWEKWKSGRATASTFREALTTPDLTMHAIGNAFFSDPVSIEVPSIFLEGSSVSMSFGDGTAEILGFSFYRRTINNNTIEIRVKKSRNTTTPASFTITIEGEWKTIE